jgi:proliferating cell nuclear antigen
MFVSMQLNEDTCIEMKEKISLTFGLRYLNSFSKAATVSDQVTIKLSSNLFVVFEYKIAEMGYIRYSVKPADKKAESDAGDRS